jgi:cholesterol transport system auxiliary component
MACMSMLIQGRFATEKIATASRTYWARGLFCSIFVLTLLAGCSALPDKPQRAAMYDFGPGLAPAAQGARLAPLPPLAIGDVSTSGGALDNTAVLYRLAYADAQQLRPYSQARWVMPPSQLVRQRLRDRLSERRTIFGAGESASLNRSQNAVLPRLLRLDLEEFSHLFTAPDASVGLVRLRATLLEITPAGEKLVGQRSIVVQQPATSPDAPGGVRALTQATDAAIETLDQWLQQQAPAGSGAQ